MSSNFSAKNSVQLGALVLTNEQRSRPLCGQPSIEYLITTLASLDVTTLFIGSWHNATHSLSRNDFSTVADLQHGLEILTNTKEHLLVLPTVTPLLTTALIASWYEQHVLQNADITCIGTRNPDISLDAYTPTSITDELVEFSHQYHQLEDKECCLESGIYLVKANTLKLYLEQHHKPDITVENLKQYARLHHLKSVSLNAPFDQLRSLSAQKDSWIIEHIKRAEIIRYWMEQGVTFAMPHTNHIDIHVRLGAGSHIASGVHLFGKTTIGIDCHIGEFTIIRDSHIADRITLAPHTVLVHDTFTSTATLTAPQHIVPSL